MRTLVATSFFLFPGIGVATSIPCRDLTLSAFTIFLCRDIIFVVSLFASWSQLLFQVATPFSCLEPSSRSRLNFAKPMWSLSCNQVVSLISAIPVATSKVCRDLTVLFFAEIYVAISIPCRDIISVASYVDICCDHIFMTL